MVIFKWRKQKVRLMIFGIKNPCGESERYVHPPLEKKENCYRAPPNEEDGFEPGRCHSFFCAQQAKEKQALQPHICGRDEIKGIRKAEYGLPVKALP
jgi:hypothetical protein